ncbi:SAM-dependent methyltransferase [Streptomyces sp. NPDC051572]|uniref:SAM-dependent methyltransferase n=1 Tax=Streptomyces sp. NPDC051572 TaxID=3155802 RepID=UPI00345059F2
MPAREVDTSRPHPARMYDFYLGGKDYYDVDQEAAEKVLSLHPDGKNLALSNRYFMHRAARMLAKRGISQFLDIGTGIPTEPNLHQVVQGVIPDARVVYVDNDPIVLRHAEALLRSTPEGETRYIHADVRESQKIIEGAQEVLDFDQPVALSMVALLHFIPDDDNPYDLIRELLRPLCPGSYVMLSHVTGDFDPKSWKQIISVYRESGISAQVRSRDEFKRFFNGLEIVDPGVCVATQWRPDPKQDGPADIALYVGVAQKP